VLADQAKEHCKNHKSAFEIKGKINVDLSSDKQSKKKIGFHQDL